MQKWLKTSWWTYPLFSQLIFYLFMFVFSDNNAFYTSYSTLDQVSNFYPKTAADLVERAYTWSSGIYSYLIILQLMYQIVLFC